MNKMKKKSTEFELCIKLLNILDKRFSLLEDKIDAHYNAIKNIEKYLSEK